MNVADRIVQGLLAQGAALDAHILADEDADLGEEPGNVAQEHRKLRVRREPATLPDPPTLTPEETRALLLPVIEAYVATPNPEYVLHIGATAGVGKTTLATAIAEHIGQQGLYVAFAAPRHDMAPTIMAEAQHPELFVDVEGRRGANSRDPEPTCLYAHTQRAGQAKGYRAIDMCIHLRPCGRAYMADGCRWHGQFREIRAKGQFVLICQHAHVFVGLPTFQNLTRLLIIDESPVGAVTWKRTIPTEAILPREIVLTDEMLELVVRLNRLALEGQTVQGPLLLEALGGAYAVLEACEPYAHAAPPPFGRILSQPNDIALKDYRYHNDLAQLLVREATRHLDGKPYPPRVIVGDYQDEEGRKGQGLTILQRRYPAWREDSIDGGWGPHCILLDATGTAAAAEQYLGRPIRSVTPETAVHQRVWQVTDRSNGISALIHRMPGSRVSTATGKVVEEWDAGQLTRQGTQLVQMTAKLAADYRRRDKLVGIVCIQRLLPWLTEHASDDPATGKPLIAYYGAARGTNDFKDVDALIVAGLPHPPPGAMYELARMVQFEEMEPMAGDTGDIPYDRETRAYEHVDERGVQHEIDVNVYADRRLAALEEQFVEAEIKQAIARARGAIRPADAPVDVFLLTNRPVPGVRPHALQSVRQMLEAPSGVQSAKWSMVLTVADAYREASQALTSADLVAECGLDPRTARDYIDHLALSRPDEWRHPDPAERLVLPRKRGRPPRLVVPTGPWEAL